MFAYLTCMTQSVSFIERDVLRLVEARHGVSAGVTKTSMPEVRGGGGDISFWSG
jgi:hypothetical protein